MTITELNAEIRSLVDAGTTSYIASDLLRRVNSALETLVAMIINADGTWDFDDTNYTDFPIGTYTLVDSQGKYSFNDKFLQLKEVQIMNQNGDYQIIRPIDQSELDTNIPLEEMFKTDGLPQVYDKISDDTIRLLPAPDDGVTVTLVAGLKIKFKRTASIFTTAEVNTGTKVPGIASPYHQLIAYMAALPYAVSYKKDRVAIFEKKIDDMTKDMLRFYGNKQKDLRKVATMKRIEFR